MEDPKRTQMFTLGAGVRTGDKTLKKIKR